MTLLVLSLLYGRETWTMKTEKEKRITETEIKSMRRSAKCTWIEYKRNEGILRQLPISSGKN
jgi:hypothetical protein